jgi:hypothetical protein
MSLLSQITKTNKQTGIKAVIYGATGMGKTTLACSAPKPLLIPTEGGYTDVDPEKVAILPQVIRDFDVLTNVLKDLVNCYSEENGLVLPDGREIKSIVLDSITATERLIHDKIIRSDKKFLPGNPANVTMESAINGYSSAYNSAAEKVSELLRRLEYFSNRGINVIIIAHSISYLEKDIAMGEEYTYTDCALYSPRNGKFLGARDLLRQYVDLTGYMHAPFNTFKIGEGKNSAKVANMTDGVKYVIGVNKNPRYEAKNRYGLENIEPIVIPKHIGWNAIAAKIKESTGKDFINREYPLPVDGVEPVIIAEQSVEEAITEVQTPEFVD